MARFRQFTSYLGFFPVAVALALASPAGAAERAKARRPSERPPGAGWMTVDVPDQAGTARPLRWRFRDRKASTRTDGHYVDATIETDQADVLRVQAALTAKGDQTLLLTDGRTILHQVVLNDRKFQVERPAADAIRQRGMDVAGTGSIFRIVADYRLADTEPEALRRAHAAFPLHRLLMETLRKAVAPETMPALSQVDSAFAFVAALYPKDDVGGTDDEWAGVRRLLGQGGPGTGLHRVPPIGRPGEPVEFPAKKPDQGQKPQVVRKEPECTTEDDDHAYLDETDFPIPGVANIKFEGIAAYVHAKCLTAAGCLTPATEGALNVEAPAADVPKCDTVYGQGGQVYFRITAKGEAGASVKKGDCLFVKDDYAVVGELTVEIAAGQPIKTSVGGVAGNSLCAATKARADIKGCVGKSAGGALPFPWISKDLVYKSTGACEDITLPPAGQ